MKLLQTREDGRNEVIFSIKLAIGFMIFLSIVILVAPVLNEMVASIVDFHSEYSVQEQLSKYLLFLVVLLSIQIYIYSQIKNTLWLSYSFLLIGLVLYLSESNMINTKVQPIFGAVCFSLVIYYLIKNRSWFSFAFLLSGVGFLFMGYLTDYLSEHEEIASIAPQSIVVILSNFLHEESYDLFGEGLIFLSALNYYLTRTIKITAKEIFRDLVPVLAAGGLITYGNGLMHFQYDQAVSLLLVAFFLIIFGFIGLVYFNNRNRDSLLYLKLPTGDNFYILVLIFFVMLPVVYGSMSSYLSLVFWSSIFLFLLAYLSKKHPVIDTEINQH